MSSTENSAPYYYGQLIGSASSSGANKEKPLLPSRQFLSGGSTANSGSTIVLPSSSISLHQHEPIISPGSDSRFRTGILGLNSPNSPSLGTGYLSSSAALNSSHYTSLNNGNSTNSTNNNLQREGGGGNCSSLSSQPVVVSGGQCSSVRTLSSPSSTASRPASYSSNSNNNNNSDHHYSKSGVESLNLTENNSTNPTARNTKTTTAAETINTNTTANNNASTASTTTSHCKNDDGDSSSDYSLKAAATAIDSSAAALSSSCSNVNNNSSSSKTQKYNSQYPQQESLYRTERTVNAGQHRPVYHDNDDEERGTYESSSLLPRDESEYGIVSSTILNLEKQLREYEEQQQQQQQQDQQNPPQHQQFRLSTSENSSENNYSNSTSNFYRPVYHHPGAAVSARLFQPREDESQLLISSSLSSKRNGTTVPDSDDRSSPLQRTIQNQAKKLFSSTLLRTTSTNSSKHNSATNSPSPTARIYQRSLSIFSSGVSPLLRKKKNKKEYKVQEQQNKELSPENNPADNPEESINKSLGSRRKSEPIMFSYDSITSELSKFQAREEKIVENINLDLEKMLMNDANVNVTGGGQPSTNGQHPQQYQQHLQQQHQQQQQQQNEAQYMTNAQLKSTMLQMGDGPPAAAAVMRQYKMPTGTPQHQHQASSSSSNSYYVSGRKLPDGAQAVVPAVGVQQFNQNTARTMHSTPQIGASQALSYKEPFYMVYDDNRRPMGAASHHTLHHPPGAHNDDNIYEEIDFLTLSNLRAAYADTLSLHSYNKQKGNNSKSGSKRSLASSSFTRWFSTRKKNSPSLSEDESPYLDIKLSKKQRPPITLPDEPQNLTKEQKKRRYIVGSIVDSENSYINSLQRIINGYKKPLEEASSTILSQNKINIVFHGLEQILQCHTIFGIALSQCVREWDEKEQIGDVFIASFSKSMVLDIYSDFINNFTNAMETARKAAKSKSAFGSFLQEKSLSSPDRLSFFGLMVKPVQRFPQFILLLSDLLKHTPADHHDRMSLQLALTQLESLADRLNERKRDAERHFAVKQLLKDYLSPSTTNSSHRYLLRQDDVFQLDLDTGSGIVMKTKCRKLYLLNDMLVCVSVPANRLKFAVALTDVDVMEDVTPATNNLIANSMLKKDSNSNTTSPKHFTVERMYCDLNGLVHDLEVINRITNLMSSLRYNYQGLSLESSEATAAEIREEIRKKDAQITLIDRSCLQIRIRSKNYKDIICIQMTDPEVKKDWLTDVRLAKLALDRANNPAWDIVNESLSASRANLSNTIIMHRVPLFVKSLPIFATTDHSQLTCALHYRLARRDDIVFEQNAGVLWICNVNESGSQLGALATNGSDISLIHSYELCDSHVTCIESVGTYAVWIGLRQGRIIVIDASSPGEWQQFASLEVPAEVTCIKHLGAFVYVGLANGDLTLFNATHYEEPIVLTLAQGVPITCLLAVNREMFACCADKIWIVKGSALNRSYSLSNSNSMVSSPSGELVSPNGPEIKPIHPHMLEEDCRPNLLAHCGIGLWVSLIGSPIIKLYHTETFKHLQDVNVSSNVKRILGEMIDPMGIFVTSMLATRGLLWIGTNVGVVVTLNLPRLQGVPLISGCLNVALHRHTGPVTILLSLTSTNAPIQNVNAELQAQLQAQTPGSSAGSDAEQAAAKAAEQNSQALEFVSRQDDAESIYGLYSDLMNVENYVRPGGESRQGPTSGATSAVGKMTWDLAQLQLGSDGDSNTESIYQDGGILRRKQAATMPRKMMEYPSNIMIPQANPVMAMSPAKSQNSIYDTNMISAVVNEKSGGGHADAHTNSTSLGQSGSIYDIAPFRAAAAAAQAQRGPGAMPIPVGEVNGRAYDTNNNSTATKTSLLLTGGNGYKRITFGDAPYSSQHAHCCIWEYKL